MWKTLENFKKICNRKDFVGSKVACLYRGRLLCYLRDNYQHIDDPNMWDFPGGERELGETALQCVIRETFEEFNITLEEDQFTYASSYKSHQEGRKDVAFFVATISEEQVAKISFGEEGQYWQFIETATFLSMTDAVKELQISFSQYLTSDQETKAWWRLDSGPIDLRRVAWFTVRKVAVNMSDLFWLSDAQMARLEPFFPKSHGKPRIDDRHVLSGIIFINRNGLRWRDAPTEYGPH